MVARLAGSRGGMNSPGYLAAHRACTEPGCAPGDVASSRPDGLQRCGGCRSSPPSGLSFPVRPNGPWVPSWSRLSARVCSLHQITGAFFEVGGQYRRNI